MPKEFEDSVAVHRVQMNSEAIANLVYHNKKRKSQEEQPERPTPKHACLGQFSSTQSEDESSSNNLQGSLSHTHLVGTKILQSTSHSDPDSEKDSNSLPAYSDSITSSFGKQKSEPEYSNAYAYSHMVGEYKSCDSSTAVSHQDFPGLDLEDNLLGLEMYGNYAGSECGNESMELGEEKELQLEDLLYSNGAKVNPNMLVLSSGRWIINQDDARPIARKPTIDQEFEQYFSSLMLL